MAMPKTISEVVREALLLHPQGLTVRELSKLTGYAQDLLIACLRRTYGCYIADYVISPNGARQFNAVWCCVAVPANLKKPLASEFPIEIVDEKQAEAAKKRKAKREAAKQNPRSLSTSLRELRGSLYRLGIRLRDTRLRSKCRACTYLRA